MGSFFIPMRRSFRILLSACLIPLMAAVGHTAESSEPINIEADRMISQENDNTVVFIGNVDAKQGKLTIRSDEMTVYYSEEAGPKGKQTSSKLKKLICKNNVQIVQGDWTGTGNRMDYFADERKVVLTGDAKAWQGQNMVSGKTIVYYLDEKRSIIDKDENQKGRVKAVLQPGGDKKQ